MELSRILIIAQVLRQGYVKMEKELYCCYIKIFLKNMCKSKMSQLRLQYSHLSTIIDQLEYV